MERRGTSGQPYLSGSPKRSSSSTITGETRGGLPRKSSSELISSESGLSHSSYEQKTSLIDNGQLEGKIKISSAIRNSDLCISTNYRADGRYYAVALAEGVINVYSSKSNDILYELNKNDNKLSLADVSATCVRFRPFHMQQEQKEETSRVSRERRKSSGSDTRHFLPPIVSPQSGKLKLLQPFSQKRRMSSTFGIKSEELEIFMTESERATSNNMVTASFTDGSVKTFNFITEQCVNNVQEHREVLTMGFSKSGGLFATAGSDGCIFVYDDETKTKMCSYQPPFEYKSELLRTYSIAFHPESESEFLSGGWNKYIQFLDVRVPNLLVCKVAGPKICGEGLDFHPSGREFCAAAWGKREGVRLYDYSMRKPFKIASVTGSGESPKSTLSALRRPQSKPSKFLYSARYFMDNYIAFGGSYSGGMTVIDRNSENIIAGIHELKKSIYCVDTFKSKVLFIVDQEVCVSEIFF